jgi:hypothetical protein
MGYVLEEELKPVAQSAVEYAAMKMLESRESHKIFHINNIRVECSKNKKRIICQARKSEVGIILYL